MKTKISIMAFCILMMTSQVLWARWQPDGLGSININSGQTAKEPSLSIAGGIPYIAWVENNGTMDQVYVKHWDGSTWIQDGSSLNVNTAQHANSPSLAFSNNIPYVAWSEGNTYPARVYVKHWNGSAWVQDGGSLNINSFGTATNPSLGIENNIPYVAWQESNTATASQVFVKQFSGGAWGLLRDSLNINVGQNSQNPSLATYGGYPQVAWQEYAPANNGDLIYEKFFDPDKGGAWRSYGGSIYTDVMYADRYPSLAMNNGKPYIAWIKYFIGVSPSNPPPALCVTRWNGSTWQSGIWEQMGGNISGDGHAAAPCLVFCNSIPYVAWEELGKIYVKHWDGSSWIQDGDCLNNNLATAAHTPSLVAYNGILFIAWVEGGQIYEKRWRPETVSLVSPNYSIVGKSTKVTIFSGSCANTPTASLLCAGNPSIVSKSSKINNSGSYTFEFDISGGVPSTCDVQVSADNFQTALKQSFYIVSPCLPSAIWKVSDLGVLSSTNAISGPCGMSVGDADQNLLQELYVVNQDQKIFCLKKGIAGWTNSPVVGSGSVAYSSTLFTDANSDQTDELYVASITNNHCYQINTIAETVLDMGAGNAGASKIFSLAKADVDHDGMTEIYAACNSGVISTFKSAGGTAWSKTDILGCPSSQPYALISGDGNNDGELEVYSANSDGKIYQYKYSGTTWQVSVIGNATGAMNGVGVGDGDNDGQNEVYAACQDGKVYQYRWENLSWTSLPVGPSKAAMRGVTISDGNNDGLNEVYAASEDGHVYAWYKSGVTWTTQDLGNAETALYALTVGDADNDHQFEVYALGQNNHVVQFKFESLVPTPTPTSVIITPPDRFFKVYRNQVNPNRGESALVRWSQPFDAPVTITVYNMVGDKIITLVDHQHFGGGQFHETTWNGHNGVGQTVGSGIYIIHIKTDKYETYGKCAVIK